MYEYNKTRKTKNLYNNNLDVFKQIVIMNVRC